jgi:hypothetical protein
MTTIVITAVTAVIVLVAVLVLVLDLSQRRGRRDAFGPDDEAEYDGPPGYGRPAGYDPPPLWRDRLPA